MTNIRHLIIGNGYLGSRLCNNLAAGNAWYSHRSLATATGQEKTALIIDVNTPETWEALSTIRGEAELVAYMLIPPSRIDVAVLPQFLDRLDRLPLKRRILASSTVVYGQAERVVDADSEVIIDSKRAHRQHDIEQAWMQADHACVVRLAGIYGPGRVIGLQTVRDKQVINGAAEAWLNLIHVDDAATLLLAIAELPVAADYELGCDGVPMKRRDYYGMLAELLQQPAPEFASGPSAQNRGRCCTNELTVARTGWLPRHTDIRQVVTDILAGTT